MQNMTAVTKLKCMESENTSIVDKYKRIEPETLSDGGEFKTTGS